MDLILVTICLSLVVGAYFGHNPIRHGSGFLVRRFTNWFPLGMTYAFLYMGRYNLNVSKNALGALMTKENFGLIFGVGTFVYAVSFLVNGPLVDKIGGKRGILISAVGASVCNALMGVATWLLLTKRAALPLVATYATLYGFNMYFQSYGAVSIIKVKAYWFHVRERGIFGAIFGTLISFGVYFAFDWGQAIAKASALNAPPSALRSVLDAVFGVSRSGVDAVWTVFFIPAILLVFWAIMDALLIKDTPGEAGHEDFDTADASSGEMHIELTTLDLLKRVFTSPIMLTVAAIELTSGVMRNGIYQWYFIFAKEVKQPGAEFFLDHWGLLLCLFGIVGGFGGGIISDKLFHSRRAPPAAIFSAFMFIMAGAMALFLYRSPLVVGCAAVLISMAVIGVHSLMSGTAAADFGGRKATATCSGIVDGFVYLGSTIQSVSLGYLTTRDWHYWPLFLMPFALLGVVLALSIWKKLPAATHKYLREVEHVSKA
jgi:MFS transporter, OPA family, glycerol-3-phosphate transporter